MVQNGSGDSFDRFLGRPEADLKGGSGGAVAPPARERIPHPPVASLAQMTATHMVDPYRSWANVLGRDPVARPLSYDSSQSGHGHVECKH